MVAPHACSASTRIPRKRLRSGRSQVESAIPAPGAATRASSCIACTGRGRWLIAQLHTIAPNERASKGKILRVRPQESDPSVTPARERHDLVRYVDAGRLGAPLPGRRGRMARPRPDIEQAHARRHSRSVEQRLREAAVIRPVSRS